MARSTSADASESHDWRIYAEFAQALIGIARPLYTHKPISLDLDQTPYARFLLTDVDQLDHNRLISVASLRLRSTSGRNQ